MPRQTGSSQRPLGKKKQRASKVGEQVVGTMLFKKPPDATNDNLHNWPFTANSVSDKSNLDSVRICGSFKKHCLGFSNLRNYRLYQNQFQYAAKWY